MLRRRADRSRGGAGRGARLARRDRAQTPPAELRFGVLPVGGAVESRDKWALC